jgi:DNA-binding GntR family transcriptional regulator
VLARGGAASTRRLLADVLHRFDVWAVLDCHAVYRAALSPRCDLAPARSVLAKLNQQVIAAADPGPWNGLELQLHHAIDQQGGNPVVAAMGMRLHVEWQAIWLRHVRWPIHDLSSLWLLQSQHRQILRSIEAGQPEEGVRHTRAHHQRLREQLLRALPA